MAKVVVFWVLFPLNQSCYIPLIWNILEFSIHLWNACRWVYACVCLTVCVEYVTVIARLLKCYQTTYSLTFHSASGFWDSNIVANFHPRGSACIIINLDLGSIVIFCAFPELSQGPLHNVYLEGLESVIRLGESSGICPAAAPAW